jgi:hypothetical protein
LSSNERRKKEIFSTLLNIEDMGRVPKRLKTGDEPVVVAVKVKVKSDDDKEDKEESLDNDNDEEEEDKGQEGHVAQPVAQVELPRYVPPRPKYARQQSA